MVIYGTFLMSVGLFFGSGFRSRDPPLPLPVLGILLLFEALALIMLARDVATERADRHRRHRRPRLGIPALRLPHRPADRHAHALRPPAQARATRRLTAGQNELEGVHRRGRGGRRGKERTKGTFTTENTEDTESHALSCGSPLALIPVLAYP